MSRPRRAGSRWRILVHNIAAGGGNGVSQHIQSHPGRPTRLSDPEKQTSLDEIAAQHSTTTILPGTEFDELVVGSWLHVEQMDTGRWWANIGGVTVWVDADRDGRPRHVSVLGPGDYDGPRKGCAYECTWSDL